MKRINYLIVFFLLITLQTVGIAQTFGLQAGANFSTLLLADDDETYSDDNEFKSLIGFHFGPTVEFELSDIISIESGLFFSMKGNKYEDEDEDYTYEEKTKLAYIEVPITAKATFEVGEIMVFGKLGPYAGFGIGGKSTWKEEFDGDSDSGEEDIQFGSNLYADNEDDEDDFKALDYGLLMGAGVQLNAIEVGLSYALGIANLMPDLDSEGETIDFEDNDKIKNRVFSVSVGYKFNQ